MIRSGVGFLVEFLGHEAHTWLLLMLGGLYGTLAIILTYLQINTGTAPDCTIMKHVGDTLVWWGGIVATGSTAKKMTSMIKGTSVVTDPAGGPP